MGTGTYSHGDVVRPISGIPAGDLRVITTLDIYTRLGSSPNPVPLQVLNCTQLATPLGVIWPGREDIVGGSLFPIYDTEVTLVARAADLP